MSGSERRALRAVGMLQGIGPDGFDAAECRRYDACFEAGDGGRVVGIILRMVDADPLIVRALASYPACRYTDLPGWRKKYAAARPEEPCLVAFDSRAHADAAWKQTCEDYALRLAREAGG